MTQNIDVVLSDTKPTLPPLSRRNFLQLAGLAGTAGAAALTGCHGKTAGGTGWMPDQYNDAGTFPVHSRGRVPIDVINPSICRDDRKCILCGQCADVCNNAEAVMGHYELPLINDIPCVHCGQCTLWCPSGAITEVDDTDKVQSAIDNPDLTVIAHTAPSTRIGLGEEFGLPPGTNVEGKQVAALKALGFDTVFDTNFTADLTITEEATELVHRITGEKKAPLPQFTSCCPGWVKFCEYFYADLIANLSSAKSPIGMIGPMIKTYYAEKAKLDPKKIVVVGVMPCTAKKYEAARPEMNSVGRYLKDPSIRDNDVIITTRELARFIKKRNVDWEKLDPKTLYDKLLSAYSGGGAIFGATGGVMEAAVRSAYFYITKQNPPKEFLNMQPIRGLNGVKEDKFKLPVAGKETEVRIAVVTGLANAHVVLDQVREDVKSGTKEPRWHFIEFMACPGGCIAGGGQPKTSLPPSDSVRKARTGAIYSIDERMTLRLCHENPEIVAIYKDFLGEPCSEKSEELLHTTYFDKSNLLVAKKKA
ncbi:MAG: [FeFe] hydrogenase, group A [Planctomycetaceae bacterium]|jgi:iron-only hydrogenase group A|nr:[FeFe] hydrogenase, group A [Planctomycetaceae bacterium]